MPLESLFDYKFDEGQPEIGQFVLVPFGPRRMVGVVVDLPKQSAVESKKLRAVQRVLRDIPALSNDTLTLLAFCSRYYHYPLGATINTAVPAGLRQLGRKPDGVPDAYTITPVGKAQSPDAWPSSAKVRRALLGAFQEQQVLARDSIDAFGSSARQVLRTFLRSGWIEPRALPSMPAHLESAPKIAAFANAVELNSEQQQVLAQISRTTGEFHCHVLQGITGSGKTEIYLRLIDGVVMAGRQALLLVPEINLTPQLTEALANRFGAQHVAVLHSAMAHGERLSRWLDVAMGRASIVVGTRLAVLSQIPRLGLIIVDEEHDASYKQQDGLRYSARDVAVTLGKQRDAPVVLGSATPSLESMRQALRGRYQLHRLTQRASGATPIVEIISTRGEKSPDGLSAAMVQALQTNMERGEQSLLFINRRGYAPTLYCSACGWIAPCHRCSARLTVHTAKAKLDCHYCGHVERIPSACPVCGNQDLLALGQGTQRIEQAIAARFPAARIARIDRDSTRGRDAFQSVRRKVTSQAIDILVGTQMLAKGHDFPRLTLVGVVGADQGLLAADFRAEERLFSLLLQVVGRAGRGENPGRALVQTAFPEHPIFAALKTQDFDAFVLAQLTLREQAGFPPFLHQVLIRAEATVEREAKQFLLDAARVGQSLASEEVIVFDPVPATLARVAGKWRFNLLVQSASRTALHAYLDAWLPQLNSTRVRWSVDVDPLEL